jgi:large subunit ribosomal protein L30
MADQLKVTLRRSHIGRPEKHRAILNGLGLNRVNKTVIVKDSPEIRGMINKVAHLIQVSE